MRKSTTDLEQFLESLAHEAQAGDRLPPIRDLMRRFGASQMVVQRVFQNLKDRGLIESQVGRGTYFQSAGAAAAPGNGPAAAGARAGAATTARSVLLLRRSISIARGRVLVEKLQQRFAADGHRVLEVSYTDPEHARTILKGLPRLDACVIQSSYKTITIELLASLRERCDVVAIDGAALIGADIESVGTEWGEPLAAAIATLWEKGHRRIAYASTSAPYLATELGQRRFLGLRRTMKDVELQAIVVPHLPDGDYSETLVDMVKASLDGAGRPPYTALVAWGIEDGAKFRGLMSGIGVDIPSRLSVALLGRTDLINEHAGFFDAFGSSVADQVEGLHQVINARWADPGRPYGVRLVPVSIRAGDSIAAPARG